jgi:hypothetical protein
MGPADLPEPAAGRRKNFLYVSQLRAVLVVRHAISRLSGIREAAYGVEILQRPAHHEC